LNNGLFLAAQKSFEERSPLALRTSGRMRQS
jgi:hypothetical protein